MIPENISSSLEHQDISVLYEIRDLVADLILARKMLPADSGGSGHQSPRREVLEERHSDSVTYRLERVSCGKNCKGCPHGPYWYGYWREGGRTRSKYIGKNLKELGGRR